MTPTLDLRVLRTFVFAARSRSLSATAVEVSRTQSAVTMQIQRLEEAVGRVLFHRSGSGIRLTESGKQFLRLAERILQTHDEAISNFVNKGLYGSVSFGCPEDYLASFGGPLLQSFGVTHSTVKVTVVAAPTDVLHKLLQKRQIDLGIVSIPKPTKGDNILRYEPLVWVGAQPKLDLPEAGEVLPLALSASNTMDHKAACEAMDSAGIKYRISLASNSLAGSIAIARSGLAISVITQKAVPADLFVLNKYLPRLPQLGVTVAFASAERSSVAEAFGQHIERTLPSL